MVHSTFRKFLSRAAVLLAALALGAVQAYCQKTISYQTEDGWTIYGSFYLPEGASAGPAPVVLMLTDPGWDVRSNYNVLALPLMKRGFAALSIDVRGAGQSARGKHLGEVSLEDQTKIQLDIKGAIKFLASQKEIDAHRIAIVGTGVTAGYAAMEASDEPAIQALVFISGDIPAAARSVVGDREDMPVLCIAGKEQREDVKNMAEIYSLSPSENSDFLLSVGHGTVTMAHDHAFPDKVADWLANNVESLGTETPVSFESSDGWVLHGFLRVPDRVSNGAKVPGVVFVHGANHDQGTYYDLSRAAAKKGLAILTFDVRGKNRDPKEGKGNGVPLPETDVTNETGLSRSEQAKIYLDVKAAVDFLASQKQVDGTRIGLVAATAAVPQAIQAAVGDPKVKTIVMLTAAAPPSPEAKKYLSTDIPIFAIASTEDINPDRGNLSDITRQTYELSGSKKSQFLLYDNAGRGSEMLKTKPELQTMVVRWLTETLGAVSAAEKQVTDNK